MQEVSSYEAKTHLPKLLRAAEAGETIVITRHGQPVAQMGPYVQATNRLSPEELMKIVHQMREERDKRSRVTIEEILSARDEGRRF